MPTPPPTVGLVDCHDCPDTHRAEYRGINAYGQHVYTVACGPYIERYTDEAVRPLPEGNTP